MHRIRKLNLWKRSIELAVEVHKRTSEFPSKERYGLCEQMNRAADSIPSNISEGGGRNSRKEFLQFLSIANGSAYELQSQVIISQKLGYIQENKASELLQEIDELQKMNYSLQKSLKNKKT